MLPKVRIEDDVEDVLGKAMRGLGMTASLLATKAGLAEQAVIDPLKGCVDAEVLGRLADVLLLDCSALRELCRPCEGPVVELPDSLLMINTAHPVPGYAEMTVNSYLLRSATEPSNAIAFDTGSDPAAHRKILSEQKRELRQLFLTHTHHDHIAAYDALVHPGIESFAPEQEAYKEAKPVRPGQRFDFAEFSIRALETSGHSPGGTSYCIEGLDRPAVIVGDAIFCRSVGKVPEGLYQNALQMIDQNILGLPDETILCPGHGPISTVAFEKAHNPFFAGRY